MVKEKYSHWLPKGLRVLALTIGETIYYDVTKGSVPPWLRNHELAHVKQYLVYGKCRFLFQYMIEYCVGRLKGLNHQDAYLSISFEVEARKAERE